MDACDPDADIKNLREIIKQNTGLNVSLSRKEICQIYKDIQDNKLPLPPLVITSDRTYLLDKKSPLKAKDYEIVFNSSSKVSDIKRILRKVGALIPTKPTKEHMLTSIENKLKSMGVREPIKLASKRKLTKVNYNSAMENVMNTRSNNGMNTRSNNGMNTRTNNGMNTRTNNGVNTRTNNGVNTRTNNGVNTRTNNSVNTRTNNSVNKRNGDVIFPEKLKIQRPNISDNRNREVTNTPRQVYFPKSLFGKGVPQFLGGNGSSKEYTNKSVEFEKKKQNFERKQFNELLKMNREKKFFEKQILENRFKTEEEKEEFKKMMEQRLKNINTRKRDIEAQRLEFINKFKKQNIEMNMKRKELDELIKKQKEKNNVNIPKTPNTNNSVPKKNTNNGTPNTNNSVPKKNTNNSVPKKNTNNGTPNTNNSVPKNNTNNGTPNTNNSVPKKNTNNIIPPKNVNNLPKKNINNIIPPKNANNLPKKNTNNIIQPKNANNGIPTKINMNNKMLNQNAIKRVKSKLGLFERRPYIKRLEAGENSNTVLSDVNRLLNQRKQKQQEQNEERKRKNEQEKERISQINQKQREQNEERKRKNEQEKERISQRKQNNSQIILRNEIIKTNNKNTQKLKSLNIAKNEIQNLAKSKGISIKSAFRKLSLKYHPNKGGNLRNFQLLSDAYEELSKIENKIERPTQLLLQNKTKNNKLRVVKNTSSKLQRMGELGRENRVRLMNRLSKGEKPETILANADKLVQQRKGSQEKEMKLRVVKNTSSKLQRMGELGRENRVRLMNRLSKGEKPETILANAGKLVQQRRGAQEKEMKLRVVKNTAAKLQMMTKLNRTNRKEFMDRIAGGQNPETVMKNARTRAFKKMRENVRRKENVKKTWERRIGKLPAPEKRDIITDKARLSNKLRKINKMGRGNGKQWKKILAKQKK